VVVVGACVVVVVCGTVVVVGAVVVVVVGAVVVVVVGAGVVVVVVVVVGADVVVGVVVVVVVGATVVVVGRWWRLALPAAADDGNANTPEVSRPTATTNAPTTPATLLPRCRRDTGGPPGGLWDEKRVHLNPIRHRATCTWSASR
jgi:hypothetical protein